MDFLEKLFNIKNKVVVITGGSGVLGGQMAEGFLNAGAKVILIGRNEEKLNKKVKELNRTKEELIAIKCDVLLEEDIIRAKEEIISKFDRIDVLVNAAGGNMPGATVNLNETVFDLKFEEFKKVVDLNFYGTVLPTFIFGKTMAENKAGSIINISSMAAQRAITRVVGYSAAKSAIENFTRWMAVELATKYGDKIRVNAIAPGFFITEQNKSLLLNNDGSITERGKSIINMTPFKRFGYPEEVVGAVLWLASDASKFVTGTVIPIDGGFSIFSGV
ncbi:MAG: SDR family oxidoreductase [Melioribacter sp.]|nr:SDR family oxidoreductase [Melioribacter sp.]